MKRDPINILADRMKQNGQLNDNQLQQMTQQAQEAVQEATTWALEQPYPPLEAAYEDIWV
jgi:pyruvate dehydrogenase E1 component alpha subunit